MPKQMHERVQEQLGGLQWLIMLRDQEIEQLQARVAELEAQLPKDPKKKEDK